MENQKEYRQQLFLSFLDVGVGLPGFILLVVSFVQTRTALVLTDSIDVGGNLLKNMLILFISIYLQRNQKYSFNFGVGKIEACSTLVCDLIMVFSLLVSIVLAIRDFLAPHAPGSFLVYVVLLKAVNVACDLFMTWREWRLTKTSDSLVFKTKLASEISNAVSDSVTLISLLLMNFVSNARWTWYISPVVAILMGIYLIYMTIGRMKEALKIILDKTADEEEQMIIMRSLSSVFDEYEDFRELRTRTSGGTLFVELNLGFNADTSYEQLQALSDRVYAELSKKIPKCNVSLIIPARQEEVRQPEEAKS